MLLPDESVEDPAALAYVLSNAMRHVRGDPTIVAAELIRFFQAP